MATSAQCPRCAADRLSVVYYDAEGNVIGGHSQCPDCGPRHAQELTSPTQSAVPALLERKAS